LLKQGAANAEVDWQRGTQVTVWMVPTASTSEINAVGSQLKALPACTPASTVTTPTTSPRRRSCSRTRSVRRAHRGPGAHLVALHADAPRRRTVVISEFAVRRRRQGDRPLQEIHTMEETITVLQWVFLAIAVVLLLSAAS